MKIKVKGTPAQAMATAQKWGVDAVVMGEQTDPVTGGTETTLRIPKRSHDAARRWAADADDTFPVGVVVNGYD
jgi:hypothetical protein